jgi:hypothetical protein
VAEVNGAKIAPDPANEDKAGDGCATASFVSPALLLLAILLALLLGAAADAAAAAANAAASFIEARVGSDVVAGGVKWSSFTIGAKCGSGSLGAPKCDGNIFLSAEPPKGLARVPGCIMLGMVPIIFGWAFC